MTDYLTCGECLREFPLQRITLFIQHKKLDCDDEQDVPTTESELQCNYCPQGFMTAWGLLVHAQITHNLKIFLENASRSLHSQAQQLNPSQLAVPFNQIKCDNVSLPVSDSSNHTVVQANSDSVYKDGAAEVTTSNTQNILKNKQTELCGVIRTVQGNNFGSSILVKRDLGNGQRTISSMRDTQPFSSTKLTESRPVQLVTTFSQPGSVKESDGKSGLLLSALSGQFNTPKSSPVVTGNAIKTASSINLRKGIIVTNLSTSTSVKPVDKSFSPENSQHVGAQKLTGLKPVYSPVNMQVSTGESMVIKSLSTSLPKRLSSENVQVDSANQSADTVAMKMDNLMSEMVDNVEDGKDKACDLDAPETTEAVEECCNDQGCGVTVIPGSHEHLKKCCNAVVPKKRKRHMEQKHMPFSWGSSRYASRKLLYRSRACNARSMSSQLMNKGASAGTIYIDVEPESLVPDDKQSGSDNQQGTSFRVTQSVSPSQMASSADISMQSVMDSGKQHSLILKPGAVFSIPFTYTIPTSLSLPSVSGISFSSSKSIGKSSETKPMSEAQTRSTPNSIVQSKSSGIKVNQFCAKEMIRTSILARKSSKSLQSQFDDDRNRGIKFSSKPFKCDKCIMAFNQRIHLKKHMSKHTGIKPYKCGECNYSTVERSHLKVHIRIHTGEKPFKCTYCEYATAQNSTLKIHLKRHHGGKMFQCGACDKQFTQEQQLVGHVSEHGTTGVVSSVLKVTSSPASTATIQSTDIVSSVVLPSSSPLLTNQEPASGYVTLLPEISTNDSIQNIQPMVVQDMANEIEDIGHVISIPEISDTDE